MRIHAIPFFPGRSNGVLSHGVDRVDVGTVVVLRQSQLGDLKVRPAGVVVVDAAPLSHPMIHLLGLGVPTVAVTREQAVQLREGEAVCVDATRGIISTEPDDLTEAEVVSLTPPRAGVAVTTADGMSVALRASVSSAAGARKAVENGATAIGLVRSEYLVREDASQPDAAFYEQQFREICRLSHPLPVVIRLLDLAADKRPRWLRAMSGLAGPLGLQGSRLYGVEPVRSVFHAQIDAVGRVAPQHDISLLVPYVALVEEFRRWRGEIEQRLPTPLAVGAMVETPAAALAIKDWLATADFVAVGCNDLMQCLFAADRDLGQVSYLLDPYAPVLLRFLKQVAEEAGSEIDRIQLCGLLPQAAEMMRLLLGLGYRNFSVEPLLIPHLAHVAQHCDTDKAQVLALAACVAENNAALRALLGLPAQAAWMTVSGMENL